MRRLMRPALAFLLASGALAAPDAELELEKVQVRKMAANARWSAGTGVFFPYAAVAAGMSGADIAKKAVYGVFVCVQVQAISARGALYLDRQRAQDELDHPERSLERERRLNGIAARLSQESGIGDLKPGAGLDAISTETHRRHMARQERRVAAIDAVAAEDGHLDGGGKLTAVSGTDYQLVSGSCPVPEAR